MIKYWLYLTLWRLMTYIYIYIYMSCRTANLQTLHFICLVNKCTYWIFQTCCTFSVFFSSKCRLFHNATFFGSCIVHILHTGCAKIKKKIRHQRVNKFCDIETEFSLAFPHWFRWVIASLRGAMSYCRMKIHVALTADKAALGQRFLQLRVCYPL
jgi:hypothetical protein